MRPSPLFRIELGNGRPMGGLASMVDHANCNLSVITLITKLYIYIYICNLLDYSLNTINYAVFESFFRPAHMGGPFDPYAEV